MDPSRKRMIILMTALVTLLAIGQGAIILGWEAGLSLSWMVLGLALILAGLFGPRLRRWTGLAETQERVWSLLRISHLFLGVGFLVSGAHRLLDVPRALVYVVLLASFGLGVILALAALVRALTESIG